jgi:hypothetical protein
VDIIRVRAVVVTTLGAAAIGLAGWRFGARLNRPASEPMA